MVSSNAVLFFDDIFQISGSASQQSHIFDDGTELDFFFNLNAEFDFNLTYIFTGLFLLGTTS